MGNKQHKVVDYSNPPETLKDHPFFGLNLDPEQRALVDSVWAREKKVYLIDAIAGSGKTLMATALGMLMVKYGIFDKIVYITFPGIYEKTQGFLPGDLLEKSEPYFQPLYDAILTLNELPEQVCNTNIEAIKNGTAFIDCTVSTYMRGINLNNAFVIVDEAENADLSTLAKVISRINDDCLAMIIGHAGQCDMYDKTQSGFTACIDYQVKYHPDLCAKFELHTNHRGKISQYADLMLQEYSAPKYGFVYVTYNHELRKTYVGTHVRTMDPENIDDTWFLGAGNEFKKDFVRCDHNNMERFIVYECNSQDHLDYIGDAFKTYKTTVTNLIFVRELVNKGYLEQRILEEIKDGEEVFCY